MRKRWLNFLKYCLRVDCVDRVRDNGRLLSDVVDRFNEVRRFYNDSQRLNQPDIEYWRGYMDGIAWVLKVK